MTRSDLIRTLTTQREEHICINKISRGNVLWSLWQKPNGDKYIICHELVNKGNGWEAIEELETTPPSHYNCPRIYLTTAGSLCYDWRQQVEKKHQRVRDLRRGIKEKHEEAQAKGQKVRVILTPRAEHKLTVYELDVEYVTPTIAGRNEKTGVLYSVPLRYVKEVKII